MFAIIFSMTMIMQPQESREDFAKRFFNEFSFEKLDSLNNFYAPEIEFVDPLGSHQGVESIRDYYANMYQNVKSIRFDFSNSFQNGDTVVLVWTMYCAHSALNAGKEFSVDGMSYIRFDPKSGKAVYHRDYFDLGEMIYENVPVLKTLIGLIKSRAANK